MKNYLKPILFCALGFTTLTLASCSEKPQLTAPQNIIYKGGILSWDPVLNANQYKIKVNKEKPVYTDAACLTNLKMSEDFKVEITALNKENTFTKSFASTQNFHFTEMPKNVRNDDGIIRWDEVDGCSNYEIFDTINLKLYQTSNNFFGGYESNIDNKYSFQVKTDSDSSGNVESNFSDKITFRAVNTPNHLAYDYDLKGITWNSNIEDNGFELQVDDEVHKIDKSVTLYEYIPNDTKTHEIRVRALSIDSTFSSSPFSDPIYIEKYKPFKKNDFEITRNTYTSFKIRIYDNYSSLSTLIKYLNDEFVFEKDEFEFPIFTGQHEILMKRLAKKHAIEDTYYLDSDFYSFSYKLLEGVKNVRLSGDRKFITWDPVEGATAYKLLINYDEYIVKDNKVSTDLMPAGGRRTFGVQPINDDESTYEPNVASYEYYKILAPTWIDLYPNGIVDMAGADEYEHYKFGCEVNGTLYESEHTEFNFLNIPEEKFDLRVKYIGLHEQYLDSNFSKAFKFERIPQVRNLRIENGKLLFDGNYINDIHFALWKKGKDNIIDYSNYKEFNLANYGSIQENDIVGVSAFYDGIREISDTDKIHFFPSHITWITNGISKLPEPTNARLSGNKITWDKVEGASSFEVNFNGETFNTDKTEFSPDFTKVRRDNYFSVRAVSGQDSNIIKSSMLVFQYTAKPIKGATKLKKCAIYDGFVRFFYDDDFGDGKVLIKNLDEHKFEVLNTREYRTPIRESATYNFQAFPYYEDVTKYYDYENTPSEYIVCNTPKLVITTGPNGETNFNWQTASLVNEFRMTIIHYIKGTKEIASKEPITFKGYETSYSRKFNFDKYDVDILFWAITYKKGALVYSGVENTYHLGGNK